MKWDYGWLLNNTLRLQTSHAQTHTAPLWRMMQCYQIHLNKYIFCHLEKYNLSGFIQAAFAAFAHTHSQPLSEGFSFAKCICQFWKIHLNKYIFCFLDGYLQPSHTHTEPLSEGCSFAAADWCRRQILHTTWTLSTL